MGEAAYGSLASVYEWLVPDGKASPAGSAQALEMVTTELAPEAQILDCACGIGLLAVGLAQAGFRVTACDASPAMVERTQALARAHAVEVSTRVCRWDQLPDQGWQDRFDAVLCVGNSLAHAVGRRGRRAALDGMASALAAGGVAQEGFVRLEVALPSPLETCCRDEASGGRVGRVVIGMDPHKRSVTIEVMAADETILGGGRFATTVDGHAAMRAYVKAWPDRVWAIEGCAGIGGHVASRLLAEGEQVVDVPAKLSARARVFATGQGRKTDATDAHSVALVGTRMAGLRPVVDDEQLAVLRVLVDRRRSLGEDHTRMVSQLHQLLLQLIPGGAKKDLSAAQAKVLLASVRPRDVVGKTRRRVAAELIADLERIYQRKKAANKELQALVRSTGTSLLDLHGVGPSGAARLLVEVADITRFPTKGHFASWNGTAPIDASSGDQIRHRLSRAGNRQINRVLHIMATVQLRNATEGRTYYDRRKAEGKTSMEAMRALKRRLSDVVYRTMLNDAIPGSPSQVTGPGGHPGATTKSSAADSHPDIDTSDKSLPGPATSKPTTPLAAAS